MIKGYCITRHSVGRIKEWPEVFCAVPLINSTVRSKDGSLALKVTNITHCSKQAKEYTAMGYRLFQEPSIEVELEDD